MKNIGIYIKSIIIPLIVGGAVGVITSRYMDLSMLNKPPLVPPGWLFPIVWAILYTLMGISYGILKSNNQTNEKIDIIYYFQLAVNALWSIFFFVFQWRLFSFLWLILLIVSVVIMIKRFYEKNKLSGLLQIPYLIWITFAAYLNLAFYLLNR